MIYLAPSATASSILWFVEPIRTLNVQVTDDWRTYDFAGSAGFPAVAPGTTAPG